MLKVITRTLISVLITFIHIFAVGYILFPRTFISGPYGSWQIFLNFAESYSNFYFLIIYIPVSILVLYFSKEMNRKWKVASLIVVYLFTVIIPSFNQTIISYFRRDLWESKLLDLLIFPIYIFIGTITFLLYKIIFERLAKWR